MRFKLKPLSFKVHEWVDGVSSWQNIYGYSNIAPLSLSPHHLCKIKKAQVCSFLLKFSFLQTLFEWLKAAHLISAHSVAEMLDNCSVWAFISFFQLCKCPLYSFPLLMKYLFIKKKTSLFLFYKKVKFNLVRVEEREI